MMQTFMKLKENYLVFYKKMMKPNHF